LKNNNNIYKHNNYNNNNNKTITPIEITTAATTTERQHAKHSLSFAIRFAFYWFYLLFVFLLHGTYQMWVIALILWVCYEPLSNG